MSIKSIALVAATASVASADASYFQSNNNMDSSSVLELGLVASQGAGVVEIYKSSQGELGAQIGTEAVNAGANSDVRVNVNVRPTQDVIAVLKVNGEVVATQAYNVVR